jgi:predicted nucleic acid-binding protein
MNGKVFVDTNIVLYALDRTAGVKHQRARQIMEELWNAGSGVLSTQVLQELCINLGRKTGKAFSLDDRRRVVENYSKWETVVNTAESILRALDIEARYRISFWDALILQAAERAGCALVYSEDMAHGQRYGSMQVVNPLI